MPAPNTITLTVPEGALCGLYPDVPDSAKYFQTIDPKNTIKPAGITTQNGHTSYTYTNLAVGLYHYGVSMDGFTAVRQIINYTDKKAADGLLLDVELCPMAGNGYESGYVMLNTREFIENCLTSHKNAWGGEYAHLFETPWIIRPKNLPGLHRQTSNEEMWAFIRRLREKSKNMHVFSLGKSPKYGHEMPIVLFTCENVTGMTLSQAAQIVRNNGKPTVQYTAQVHGNEPASAEGALAMMLDLTDEKGSGILDAIDVYIIPRVNPDGAVEVIRQSPTTGDDMNRDYLYMHNHEIRLVTGAYNLFLPEVAIDGHERFTNFRTTGEARCTDMDVQVGAGSLNHPAYMTELAMDMALAAIRRGQDLGLRSHFYANLASAAGGAAGSSYYGTRNSLSFLVETPGGTTLGRNCLERRVMAQYVLASTVMHYTAVNAQTVMNTVRKSREKMMFDSAVYDESDLFVLQHGNAPTGSVATPMIHVPTGTVTDPACDMIYNEQTIAVRSRPRATAYVVPMGLKNEAEILRVAQNHDIPWYILPEGATVPLRQYIQTEDDIQLTPETPVTFPQGAYVFPNTVPSTILSAIMEPDFASNYNRKMTFLSMSLVSIATDGTLPIYRYCHTLKSGKIPL